MGSWSRVWPTPVLAQADIATGSQLMFVCLSSRHGPSTFTHHGSEIMGHLQLPALSGSSHHSPHTLAGHQSTSTWIWLLPFPVSYLFPSDSFWSYFPNAALTASFTQSLPQGDPA